MAATLIYSIILGVLSSLTASFVWFFTFFRFLRPEVDISPKISTSVNSSGEEYFVIKVINRTPFDISLEAKLYIRILANAENGSFYVRKNIPLRCEKLYVLRKFSKRDKEIKYAFRFLSKDNLNDLWKHNNQELLFFVYAKHSISGYSRCFERRYYYKQSDIVDGNFVNGNTFDIS